MAPLFEAPLSEFGGDHTGYDVSLDGQRFLMTDTREPVPRELAIVTDAFAGLPYE